jgi:hypothetical protein
MGNYTFLIPEKVDNELNNIDEHFKSLDINGYSLENLKEVISIIACHVRKNDSSARLKLTYVNKLVPRGEYYIRGLVDLGVVERSGYYVPGESSFTYNFSLDYKSKYVYLPVTDARLINRIDKVQIEFKKQAAKNVRGRSEQVKFLKLLTIDEGYHQFIESSSDLSIDQYNNMIASATRIINKDIFYIVDDTSGRFHSNITNMAKPIRSYLRIDGKPLVNLDIKNSQPYLSTILLTNPSKISWMAKNPEFAATLEQLKVSRSKDIKKYISLVVNGELYEYLMQGFSKIGLELNRDETKRQILRILFAKNRMPKDEVNRKARQVFINNFPTVHKIFSKVRGHAKGDHFQDSKRFSILLQTIEAHLILDVVLKRISKELPRTIVMTIHDSIMTGAETDNIEALKHIILEEFTRFVGYPPRISVEF